MANKVQLETLFNKLLKLPDDTEISKILKEIEDNDNYITSIQLQTLMNIHDKSFKEKYHNQLEQLYNKYKNKNYTSDAGLHNDAAIIDRDIRILEETMKLLKENSSEHKKHIRSITKNGIASD
ncbi:hypothetical protein TPHA_0B02100 [Tetrapisispora phaffii CBS 4417]|uniref:Uncharacterized protein n=1 Tax=Tetrapisispora phaffii (strain ATCC 24235 / CBS 4417 / NBRC 1672 / NRRL Y-8282 / UCD 70-5) TaxID=1071381 RepID=G8BPF1_TETPH|nr:hypothetical protein TPHA_0B02100 [Tetrapisispora phaffii CBS 4417]CCE61882.1 hypothetical protein TPHA_0B02100 [Tetrapisispora phaffii CBS 4417]